jgi:tetratricopeptide (TPR) repeat protein
VTLDFVSPDRCPRPSGPGGALLSREALGLRRFPPLSVARAARLQSTLLDPEDRYAISSDPLIIKRAHAAALILVGIVGAIGCDGKSPRSRVPAARLKRDLGRVSLPPLAAGSGGISFVNADASVAVLQTAVASGDFAPLEQRARNLLPVQHDDERAYELYRIYSRFELAGRSPEGALEGDATGRAIDRWVSAAPASPVARIARGFFRVGAAWRARGSGWGRDVAPASGDRFAELLEAASADFESARRMEPRDPNAYVGLLNVDIGLSAPRSTMENHYRLALQGAPGHFIARIRKLEYLMPKWYGSDEEMLAFAYACSDETKAHPYAALVLPDALVEEHARPDLMDRPSGVRSLLTGWMTSSPPRSGPEGLLTYEAPWNQVADAFETFLVAHPGDLDVRYRYVTIAFLARQWDVVIHQVQAIGNRWVPNFSWTSLQEYRHAAAYAYRVYATATKQSDQDTRFFLRQAVVLDPDDADLRYAYGVYLHRLGRFDDTSEQYHQAIQLDPKFAPAYAALMALLSDAPGHCDEVNRLYASSRELKFNAQDVGFIEHAMKRCGQG